MSTQNFVVPHTVLDFGKAQYILDTVEQGSSVLAEYIWIGGSGLDLRSKTKTLDFVPEKPEDLPEWNYDGSSTDQATGHDSEVVIKPRAIFRDPFRKGKNILVMCDCYTPSDKPLKGNFRSPAAEVFEKAKNFEPWFGIEQEYSCFSMDGIPLGFPKSGLPVAQGPYYCSVGANNTHGRALAESHYRCCLFAGVKISGINAEVLPGQWEFQVGPCLGIDIGDHLWIARYLLLRLSELFSVIISFDPKPVQIGDWNGSGCHTNFSTKAMRAPGGMKAILEGIEKLSKKHKEHIEVYGKGNERRLTGLHETASMHAFSYGIGSRNTSIRIPRDVEKNGCGYFEDRRPASNIDPYAVAARLVQTICLE